MIGLQQDVPQGEASSPAAHTISFGPFTLSTTHRRLEGPAGAVQLGGRAFDILLCLLERAGTVIGPDELVARAWAGAATSESSLRVQIAALRKLLGDGRSGARYITNVPGRGYCFVAPVTRTTAGESPAPRFEEHNLPAPLLRMVGRTDAVGHISRLLAGQRLVSIVGPGGIGKTTVAVSVAHAARSTFGDAIRFVDFSPLRDPTLVPDLIASVLGLVVQSAEPAQSIVSFLMGRRMLLVLDNCEHVIDAVAALVEQVLRFTGAVHILATSREPLRVDDEQVSRLNPLENAPEDGDPDPQTVLGYPAVQLFVERAMASSGALEPNAAEALLAAEICRKLDGIPLAIEIAAGRVGVYGIGGTAKLLEDRFRLFWPGRRTALPRQQTLQATIDWSYNLLSAPEQQTLRRLAVFAGLFTLDAAVAVAGDETISAGQVVQAVANLVAKSLVTVDLSARRTSYRLLEMTRDYAVERALGTPDAAAAAQRHAQYFLALVTTRNQAIERARNRQEIALAEVAIDPLDDVRSALMWSFSEAGDVAPGVLLAASAASLMLEKTLLSECQRWAARGLSALDAGNRGTRLEMDLETSLGQALMFVGGDDEHAHASLSRGLELAVAAGDVDRQLWMLGALHTILLRAGRFEDALGVAQRSAGVAEGAADTTRITIANRLLVISHNFMGNHAAAWRHHEIAMTTPTLPQLTIVRRFGTDHRVRALCASARTLWLRGFADQAVAMVEDVVETARQLGRPVEICVSLIWSAKIFTWVGDWQRAQAAIEQGVEHARTHHLVPYAAVLRGLKGESLLGQDDANAAIPLLQSSSERDQLNTSIKTSLAEALALAGRHEAAMATIENTLARTSRRGDLMYMPEILRVQGVILGTTARPDLAGAEHCFLRSIEMARSQTALSWELRSATSLARLPLRDERTAAAGGLLASICDRFTEGFATTDVVAAKRLLTLCEPSA